MATLPEVTDVQTVPQSPGTQRTAVTTAAIIGPVDASASVDAHVVNPPYSRPSQIEDDHGITMRDGARAAFRSGARRLFAGTFEVPEFTDQVVEDSDSSAVDEGTIPGTGPIYEVTGVDVDGTAMATVTYTIEDPSTLTPDSDEAIVNTITRKVKVGTTTSGAGAGISADGKDIDLDPLRGQLLMRRFEIITVAGHPMNEQHAGLYDELQTWAETNRKTLVYAYEAAVTKTDIADLSGVVNGKNTVRFASPGHTDDAGSGFAGMLSGRPVGGTMKEQPAPRGVDFTDTYTFDDFGAHDSPAVGTFHEKGINAVYRDFGGTYRLSADLSAEGSGFYKNISTWRSDVFLRASVDDAVRSARRASPLAIPYTDQGIAGVEGAVRGALLDMVEDGILAEIQEVSLPRADEVDQSDREARILPDVTIAVRFAGQIEFVRFTVNLNL